MDSVIIGALIAGAIIGAIPAICGAIKGKYNWLYIYFAAKSQQKIIPQKIKL